jgi:hypothetical protein
MRSTTEKVLIRHRLCQHVGQAEVGGQIRQALDQRCGKSAGEKAPSKSSAISTAAPSSALTIAACGCAAPTRCQHARRRAQPGAATPARQQPGAINTGAAV